MKARYDEKCSSCVFWETFACDSRLLDDEKEYEPCEREVSPRTNLPLYNQIHTEYEEACAKALEPVNKKFKKKFEDMILKDYNFKDKK